MANVTLDFEQQQIGPPLEPDIDDLGRTNVVIAARRNGGEATASDTTGPLGTATIGTYRSQVDINPETDDVLPLHAGYHLALGTDPDPRYPSVAVDLTTQDSEFIAEVAAIDVGDLIHLESLPPELGQPEADLLAAGYTEIIGTHTRVITFNSRPGGILTHVGVLDGDGEACLQTSGAQLGAAIAAEETSFPVYTTTGPLFTTSPPTGARIIARDREVIPVSTVTSVVLDNFSRTETDSWGSPDIGPAYVTAGGVAANYDVTGGEGLMAVTVANSARMAMLDIESTNGQAVVLFNAPAIATGASLFAYVFLRATDQSNGYYARIGFDTSSVATLRMARFVAASSTLLGSGVNLGAYSAGQVWAIRFDLQDETLRAVAWNTAVDEPADWQETVTDSTITTGTLFGCRAFATSGNTNVPYTQEWHGAEVVNPQTFTVTRDPDQRMAHPVEGSVKVYRPLRLTL